METLARYDVGVFSIPPVSFNYRHTLPNKLFDFVQARLAVVVSPSPEMAAVVERYRLGAVTEDFTAASLAATLDTLDRDAVAAGKAASAAAAHELSAEQQVTGWARAVAALDRRAAAVDPTIALPTPEQEPVLPREAGAGDRPEEARP